MKEKIILVLLAVVLTIGTVAMTACAIGGAVPARHAEEVMEEETRIEEMSIEETRLEDTYTEEAAFVELPDSQAKGANGFSFALMCQLLTACAEGENFVVSPYSVWLPLAALTNATEESVKEELICALGYEDMDQETFNDLVQRINLQIQQDEPRKMLEEYGGTFENPLQIANALFIADQETVNADFAQLFTESYDGGMFSANFADPSAVDRINSWAAEKTAGKIDKVLESIDPRTCAAIANAVYFQDGWSTVFLEENTQDRIFEGAAGIQNVPFMNHKFYENLYYENEQMQVTALSTNFGGQLILMLPKEENQAEKLLAAMDQKQLDAITGADRCTVQVSLPKFKIESGIFSVLEQLRSLGVVIADDAQAHLSGLVEGEPLTISQAQQSAMIEVDEQGMTAAAVTVMGLMRMSMPRETEVIELTYDKPFAFLVTMDTQDFGQQVLFGGVVNQIEQ